MDGEQPLTDRQAEFALMQRRQIVAERYLRGQTQWTIAQSLEVDQGQISRDIKWLQEQWLEQALEDTEKRLAREIKKLDTLEREAWEAWQRSQQPATRKRRKTQQDSEDEDGEGLVEEVEDTIYRDGDPRFLELVAKAIDRRLDILGIKKSPATVLNVSQTNNVGVNLTQNLRVTDRDRAKRLCEVLGLEMDADGNVLMPARPA